MKNKIKNTTFYLVYPFFYLYYKTIKKEFPEVINTKKTLEILINKRKSLSRFGDGEFNIIIGGDIGFQSKNSKLAIELRRILESSDKRCLIGIPDVFNGLSRFNRNAKFFWLYSIVMNWHKWKKFFYSHSYVDSLCSRFYMDLADKSVALDILSLWKLLWKNREVVIIEGEHTKMGVGNDLFNTARSIRRIICPSKNAFSLYDDIFDEVCKLDKTTLILIALGPTASVLAFDLAVNGYQAVDTGHLDLEYNWLKNNAHCKEPVAGRMINELNNQNVVEINDAEYEQQIICHIS